MPVTLAACEAEAGGMRPCRPLKKCLRQGQGLSVTLALLELAV